ncbi:TetR/AcrR family transcriptional regulator [Fodinicola acaciae]|uniref:TetR/AcrR family transcriptional regulator n=1 Tax=Fodinicola acaciae TaxID=2681555 RepID=UPI0013D29A4F|nr:TetR/AcrR family transcriptional regulator [Fodinicola acaciae]
MAEQKRRTQAERRAATNASLLDGTISALSELGYARATVKEISARAGVSAGALFGHYATLTDLMLAAAEEVARRQIQRFTDYVAELPEADPVAVLPRVRAGARDPINAVWIELLVAARTDPVLRERLKPVAGAFAEAMLEASKQVPVLRALPDDKRLAVVAHVIHYFDGEALSAVLYPDVDFDQRRMDMIATMLQAYVRAE